MRTIYCLNCTKPITTNYPQRKFCCKKCCLDHAAMLSRKENPLKKYKCQCGNQARIAIQGKLYCGSCNPRNKVKPKKGLDKNQLNKRRKKNGI